MSKLDARRATVARCRWTKVSHETDSGPRLDAAILVVAVLDQILDHLAAERAKPAPDIYLAFAPWPRWEAP